MALLACTTWVNAQAQQQLADLVSEAKAEWMLGKWEAQTDNGSTLVLGIAWDLDKHVVVFHGKGTDMEFKGYSALEPGSGEVKYTGFDNRGVITKGVWGMEADELVLRVESQTPDRGSRKMAVVFTGNATEGLQVRLHQLNDSGGLVSPARTTYKFKKQK